MKRRIIPVICSILLALTGCGAGSEKESGLQLEPIPAAETGQTTAAEETAGKDQTAAGEKQETAGEDKTDVITEEQALEAIKEYCFANNPDLEEMIGSDDYTIYFDVSSNDAGEIVVLYRSYTGAEIRYYVDPASGETYSTELVPGIIDEEQRTEESFNIRDALSESAEKTGRSAPASDTVVTREDGERFEDVIMLEGMEETVKYEHARNDEIDKETYELDNAGSCTRIDASAGVGGLVMPEQLQMVYIIPSGDGTLVGTAHYSIEAAEGFGHRFAYMMHTLIVSDRKTN